MTRLQRQVRSMPSVSQDVWVVYDDDVWMTMEEPITQLYSLHIRQADLLLVLAEEYRFFPRFDLCPADWRSRLMSKSIHALKYWVREWRIQRKNSKNRIYDALHIAHLLGVADDAQATVFSDNRLITMTEIRRYLRQRGISNIPTLADCERQSLNRSCRREGLQRSSFGVSEFHNVVETNDSGCADSIWVTNNTPVHVATVPASTSTSVRPLHHHHLSSLQVLDPTVPESYRHLLWQNMGHFSALFKSPASTRDLEQPSGDQLIANDLKNFTNGMWRGRDHILEGRMTKANESFSFAFNFLKKIVVVRETRKFLPELYEIIINFQLGVHQVLLDNLLFHTAETLRAENKSSSPIALIVASLLKLDRSERLACVEQLLRQIYSCFRIELGEDHRETLSIKRVLSRSVYRRQEMGDAVTHLRNILADQQTRQTKDLYDSCGVMIELAHCYRFQRQYREARLWTCKAWQNAVLIQSQVNRADIRVRCLRISCKIQQAEQKWESAQAVGREAFILCSSILGAGDSLTALVEDELAELEDDLAAMSITNAKR